jgi:hypothetical protein
MWDSNPGLFSWKDGKEGKSPNLKVPTVDSLDHITYSSQCKMLYQITEQVTCDVLGLSWQATWVTISSNH